MPRVRQKANIYRAEDFANAIRSELISKGLQQHDLAVELGVSDATLSQLLKNPNKLSADRIRVIVQFLNIEPMVLLIFCGYDRKNLLGGKITHGN